MTEVEQTSYKRSWLAIGLGTMVLMVSYGSLLVAIAAGQSNTPQAAGPAFALGFMLVPVVYVVVAFVSGHDRAPTAVLKAMGLWLVVALPLSLFNPIFGLCTGFGIGGVVTLNADGPDRWLARTVSVLLVATYSLAILFVFPALGVMSGGLLALPALGLADYYTRNRERAKQEQTSS
ncbi:MAG: hypothetical protein ACR2NG_00915 [Acidimicrobiia bacterium]